MNELIKVTYNEGEDFNPLKNERVQMEGNRYVSGKQGVIWGF
mgnify:CR=1 FL=1